MYINKRRLFGRVFQLVLIVSIPMAIYLGALVIVAPFDMLSYPIRLILGGILVVYLTMVTVVISVIHDNI